MKKINYVEVNSCHEGIRPIRFDYANLWVFRQGADSKNCVREYALLNNRRFNRAMNLLRAFATSHPLSGNQ